MQVRAARFHVPIAFMGVITFAFLAGCGQAGAPPEIAAKACTAVEGAVRLDGGSFPMGRDDTYGEERARRDVTVDGFWLDRAEVSVARFAEFVRQTGYVTVAERPVDASLYPGADPALLKPGAAVFRYNEDAPIQSHLNWWEYVPGAYWRKPQGPGGAVADANTPVTQIAFEDAAAFAAWAGGRLPTEAEWEYASLAGAAHPVNPKQAPANANTWQGMFPVQNSSEDGFIGIAPSGCFEPNAYGLYDMLGNVWEWTADYYAPGHFDPQTDNPKGVSLEDSHDPQNPGFTSRVVKGGSFLCASNYCMRYRPAARQAQDTGLGANHIGFRVAYDAYRAQ